ncbi:MAG: transposase [Fodinibius sp.]|nr:transposase [Fodinibius sp.]
MADVVFGDQILNHKQIASRFGFAPHCHRSGSSVRGKTRSSGHGNSEMRSCMTMVARPVSHHYVLALPAAGQRKLDEGENRGRSSSQQYRWMKRMKIICAIWNSGEPYQQDYEIPDSTRQRKVA